MTFAKKESLQKKRPAFSLWSFKLIAISVLGTAIFTAFAFRKAEKFEYKNQRTDSTVSLVNDSCEIEVMTSQQLFVVDIRRSSKKHKASFKAELRDAFKAVRYETDSTTCETGWLLASANGGFSAGMYNKGQAGYDKLDSIITKTNTVPAKTTSITGH